MATRVLGLVLLALICSGASAAQTLPSGPFAGIDLKTFSADQRQTIMQASDDFEAVKAGRPPIHAKLDTVAPVPADGGTRYFVGIKYRLTIVQSLSSFGGLNGYVYGPDITFDKSVAPGNVSEISSLRFYTSTQLGKLLKKN